MTQRVGLIGKPLKRRHSQVMHDAAFDAAGIDARYVLLELEPDEVEAAVAEARASDEWLGLGVTAPYKQVVAELVDEVEDDARSIGAVNNVARDRRSAGWSASTRMLRASVAGVELAMGRLARGGDVVVVGRRWCAAQPSSFACLAAGVRRLVTFGNRTEPWPDARRALRGRRQGRRDRRRAWRLDVSTRRYGPRTSASTRQRVGMLDPGHTIPVDGSPITTPPSSTSSTSPPRRRCWRQHALAACGRRTAPRCSSPRPRSPSNAGPGWPAWPTSCGRPSHRLLADPAARA